MSWTDFRPGRRVVCISDKWWQNPQAVAGALKRGHALPRKGKVYTVRDQDIGPFKALCLCFDECGRSAWFEATSFQPLDEGRLDQFRDLLKPAREPARASS